MCNVILKTKLSPCEAKHHILLVIKISATEKPLTPQHSIKYSEVQEHMDI